MENRDATERTARPLSQVGFESGMDCLEEGSHERDLESRTGNRALLLDVSNCSASVSTLETQAGVLGGHTLIVGDQDQ